MKKIDNVCFNLLTGLVCLSGVVYFVTRHLITNDDPFALINHPAEPVARDLHIMIAPVLVFWAGLITRSHVWERFGRGTLANRRLGLVMIASFPGMVVSGYALQIVVTPLWAQITQVIHISVGFLFLTGIIGHLWTSRKGRRTVNTRKDETRKLAA